MLKDVASEIMGIVGYFPNMTIIKQYTIVPTPTRNQVCTKKSPNIDVITAFLNR
jgi:hypothetical protein